MKQKKLCNVRNWKLKENKLKKRTKISDINQSSAAGD
jgi:hypothetical protein